MVTTSLTLLVVISALSSIWIYTNQNVSKPLLGHRGDTVQLATSLNAFTQSKVTVSTCDRAGDSAHINYIYLIEQSSVRVHQSNDTFESTQIDQDFSSSTSGLVDYLYLIKGSTINYTICLGSLLTERLQGSLFIFNDDFKFSQYQDSPEQGEQLSIFSEELEIGNNNKTVCLSMIYEAPETSYYFVASRTPGGVFYTFNYSKQVFYFNHSDYQQICSIYEEEPCEITIPGPPFSFDNYVLLAFVRPNVATTAVQNHICVSVSQSNGAILITGISVPVGVVALIILIVVIVVQIVACYRRQHRKGYIQIQNSPPSYDSVHYSVY